MCWARIISARDLANDVFNVALAPAQSVPRFVRGRGVRRRVRADVQPRGRAPAEAGRRRRPARSDVRFAEDVLSILLPFLVLFTTLVMVFPKPIVWLITVRRFKHSRRATPKFLLGGRPHAASPFPYLALISLVSLMGGIMNSLNRFWVNAAAPIMLNICMIGGAGVLRLARLDDSSPRATRRSPITVSGVSAARLAGSRPRGKCRRRAAAEAADDRSAGQEAVLHDGLAGGASARARSSSTCSSSRLLAAGFLPRGIGFLYLLRRPAEPIAAGAGRHRSRHRDPAGLLSRQIIERRRSPHRDPHAEPRDRAVAAAGAARRDRR